MMTDDQVMAEMPRLERLVAAVELGDVERVNHELAGHSTVLAVLGADVIRIQRDYMGRMRQCVEANKRLSSELQDARKRVAELRDILNRGGWAA